MSNPVETIASPTERKAAPFRHLIYQFCRTPIVLLLFSWLLVFVLWLCRPAELLLPPISSKAPDLDTTYRARREFDIVISMHRERTKVVSSTVDKILASSPLLTNSLVFIYSKAENETQKSLRARFPWAIVKHRPNVGREGETFLYHILTHWNTLARHTLFMQAEPHDLASLLQRIRQHFVRETGMLSLSPMFGTCDCNDCKDPFWHDRSGILAEVYELANEEDCGTLMMSYKGQFIASAARIRGAGREVYKYLHRALLRNDGWAHQAAYWKPNRVGRDSMGSPVLGYSLERMWLAIMQCSNSEMTSRCHSIARSGIRIIEDEDCQCYDVEPAEPVSEDSGPESSVLAPDPAEETWHG